MSQAVTTGHRLSQRVGGCRNVSQAVVTCHRLLERGTGCRNGSQAVTTCRRLSQRVTGCRNVSQAVATCHRLSQQVTGCRNVFMLSHFVGRSGEVNSDLTVRAHCSSACVCIYINICVHVCGYAFMYTVYYIFICHI